ncbi:SWIM zinc finger family protein [Limisalsivibrio acetivorans]|uniref:SWIM zinc finger family protein n=1 Tax=Limisalsivibrio acetivorans TaxID=1304888 RepID=UPI0003B3FFEA|nr:hypothetical protein [Limisalsivibrio acetivorans]
MQLPKLSEEQLKNISTPINLQRAENYVGKFVDCSIEGNVLKGTIKGNHGSYTSELVIDTDPIEFKCDCENAKEVFCKHAAALGLTYIYTPWVFASEKIERSKINSFEDIKFYIKTTTLKELIEELRGKSIGSAQIAELNGISLQQLSAIVKDDLSGKHHTLTDPLKLACLYLLEKQ